MKLEDIIKNPNIEKCREYIKKGKELIRLYGDNEEYKKAKIEMIKNMEIVKDSIGEYDIIKINVELDLTKERLIEIVKLCDGNINEWLRENSELVMENIIIENEKELNEDLENIKRFNKTL